MRSRRVLSPRGPAMLGRTPGYVFRDRAIRDRPSGFRARSIRRHWKGDSGYVAVPRADKDLEPPVVP